MSAAWKPSSGTQAMDFEARWCANCKRDSGFYSGDGDGCRLLADAFAGAQPKEWRWWRGAPICDAFDGGAFYPYHPGLATADLFPVSPRRPTQGEQVRLLVLGATGAA
jgi:hypothetical protein